MTKKAKNLNEQELEEIDDFNENAQMPISRFDIQEMMQTGMHLGHKTSKLNPKMSDFILGIRNTVHVIDLEKTAQELELALKFIEDLTKKGGNLLLVGTKTPLKDLVKKTAQECDRPYVTERWLGGAFTNFDVIIKRAQYFKDLLRQQEEGKFEKYTKKERIKIEKEINDLRGKFDGLKDLTKLPEAIFVCDAVKDGLALKEARMKGIKTIAIVDTNADPSLVDYPIPANDDAISAVSYILDQVKGVILKNKSEASNPKPAQ